MSKKIVVKLQQQIQTIFQQLYSIYSEWQIVSQYPEFIEATYEGDLTTMNYRIESYNTSSTLNPHTNRPKDGDIITVKVIADKTFYNSKTYKPYTTVYSEYNKPVCDIKYFYRDNTLKGLLTLGDTKVSVAYSFYDYTMTSKHTINYTADGVEPIGYFVRCSMDHTTVGVVDITIR